MHKLRTIFLTVFVLATLLPASATDIAGWWTSSSGNRIEIWMNMQNVVMTFHYNNGAQPTKVTGYWTRFGDTFSYTSAQGVQYNAKVLNRNQIQLSSNRGTFVWNRGSQAQAPQPQPQASQGSLWSSTSGSSVQLSSNAQQVFVTIIGSNGQRYKGSGRWLSYPNKFDYSLPGFPGQAICTVVSPSQIHVNFNGKVTYWNRQ